MQRIDELAFRPKWVYWIRVSLAWAIVWAILLAGCFYSILLARTFGAIETNKMIVAWLIAYGQTFVVVEPIQILLLAGTPCLFNEETRCGRCCVRCRFIYNELLAP